MFTPSREDLAWAARFFDRKGTTGFTTYWSNVRQKRCPRIYLSLAQVEVGPLLKFQQAVGGLGSIQGPYSSSHKNGKEYWKFSVQSFEKVQAIIGMLWNQLSTIKQEQAIQALKTYGNACQTS